MEPLISLGLRRPKEAYEPGETLEFEYQLDAVDPQEIQAVEASVLWYTEGKGDEDLAVHFFERRVPAEVEGENLCPLHQVATRLPKSPLSYDGAIVKIRWCVRVRVFLKRGKETFLEIPFQLGHVPAPVLPEVVPESAVGDEVE
jgi:hypothetical protein